MQKIVDFLVGKKTYISAIIAAGMNMAIIFGWLGDITAEQIVAIEGLLAALLGSTIRSAIAKK